MTSNNGGGLFVAGNGNFTATQCLVMGNNAGDYGGGFAVLLTDTANALIKGSKFIGNHGSTGAGAVIGVDGGTANIIGTVITQNLATAFGRRRFDFTWSW